MGLSQSVLHVPWVHIGTGWTVGIQVGETVHHGIIPVRPKCTIIHFGMGWTVGIQVCETVHHEIIPVRPKCTMVHFVGIEVC